MSLSPVSANASSAGVAQNSPAATQSVGPKSSRSVRPKTAWPPVRSPSSESVYSQSSADSAVNALDGENELRSRSTPAATPKRDHHDLRSSKSSPNFTRQLSRKLQAAVNQPLTVVHRPHHAWQRPSVLPPATLTASASPLAKATTPGRTILSSSMSLYSLSGSSTPPPPHTPPSTAPTSLYSSGDGKSNSTGLIAQTISYSGQIGG